MNQNRQMRGFIAIPLTEADRQQLQLAVTQIKKQLSADEQQQVRWVPPENYHMTLYFLGNGFSEARIQRIQQGMKTWLQAGWTSFEVEPIRLEAFPSVQRPRHWVVRVENVPPLQALYQRVLKGVEALGFPKPRQAFIPHITVAHLKKGVLLTEAQRAIKSMSAIKVQQVCLFKSELKPSGAVYKPLYCVPSTDLHATDFIVPKAAVDECKE
ncbi:RNA 2',3'-cyclic phosphodiesterase [Galenea microaerophila]